MISSPKPVLEVKNLAKRFADHQVLDAVNLSLQEGEIVSLLGVSGSGKTTLFNLISGLLRPDEGQVFLHGKDITGQNGCVAYMLQKDLLLKHLTILDNVALPLLIRGHAKEDARTEAAKHFSSFGLKGYEKKYPKQISGGMAQRAAFLRTYLFSQEVALLDEPFSALDAITKAQVHEWYLRIMDELRLSTLFITHDVDEAIKLSDRILILNANPGRVVREIEIDPALKRSADFYLKPEFLQYKKEILEHLQNEHV